MLAGFNDRGPRGDRGPPRGGPGFQEPRGNRGQFGGSFEDDRVRDWNKSRDGPRGSGGFGREGPPPRDDRDRPFNRSGDRGDRGGDRPRRGGGYDEFKDLATGKSLIFFPFSVASGLGFLAHLGYYQLLRHCSLPPFFKPP